MKRFARLALLGVFVGVTAAMLFPASRSSATGIAISMSVHPGASNYLTCGWHDTCLPGQYAWETSLDWQNLGTNPTVYWRSWAIRSDGQTGYVTYGDVHTVNLNCLEIKVQVYDLWSFPKGSVNYIHTRTGLPGGTRFYMLAAPPLSGAFTSYAAGYSPATETLCPNAFKGQHLHQTMDFNFWQKAGPYPDAPAPATPDDFPVSSPGYNQAYQTWCWFC